MRGTGVGADCLDADPDERALLREPAGALDVEAGGVRAGLVGVVPGDGKVTGRMRLAVPVSPG